MFDIVISQMLAILLRLKFIFHICDRDLNKMKVYNVLPKFPTKSKGGSL